MKIYKLSPPSTLQKFNLVVDEYDLCRLQELLSGLEVLHDRLMIGHQRVINEALLDQIQDGKYDNEGCKETIEFINAMMLTVMGGSSLYYNINGLLQQIEI